jgi:hypothetical protein
MAKQHGIEVRENSSPARRKPTRGNGRPNPLVTPPEPTKRKRRMGNCAVMNVLLALGVLELMCFHFYYWDSAVAVTTGSFSAAPASPMSLHLSSNASSWIEKSTRAPYQTKSPPTMVQRKFESFVSIRKQKQLPDHPVNASEMGINFTIQKLEEMGVSPDELQGENATEIPSWSQIINNYGEEPVILGLERCEAYRNSVAPADRTVGPAGLFSTGTNLIHSLVSHNCLKPDGPRRRQPFHGWQGELD